MEDREELLLLDELVDELDDSERCRRLLYLCNVQVNLLAYV